MYLIIHLILVKNHENHENHRTQVLQCRNGANHEIYVENFRSELSNTEVVDISQFKNVDNAVNLLNTTLSKLMNKHCPIIKTKISSSIP